MAASAAGAADSEAEAPDLVSGDGEVACSEEGRVEQCVTMDQDDEGVPAPVKGRRKKAATANKQRQKPGTFESMHLSIPILKAIKRKGFQLPTPIQRKSIPLILEGVDVVGMARTGSGKTAAFVIPLLHKLGDHQGSAGARALLLSPTRELALQTYKVVLDLARNTTLRSAMLVGGDSLASQFAELHSSPDVLLATPGRLLHLLAEVPGFDLKSVSMLVLDEADRLFELGLGEQVKEILRSMAAERQVMLFSATLPSALADFVHVGLRSPEFVRLDADSKLAPELQLLFFSVCQGNKPAALLQVVQELLPEKSPTIVFTATKHRAEFLCMLLEQEGVACCTVYGSMDQSARLASIGRFRAGKATVLLVTDVAARGLDIPLLDNVINYDFTPKPKLFVHRAGRVARGGRAGTAYSFVTADELPYLIDLHLFLSRPLKVVPGVEQCGGASEVAQEGDGDVSWLGSYPDTLLDLAVKRVEGLVAQDPSLEALVRTCENSFKLYARTRPPAATESLRRARQLGRPGQHPVLMQQVGNAHGLDLSAEALKADIAAAVKQFRPAATVLEAQVATGRKGEGAGHAAVHGLHSTPAHERAFAVMAAKRVAHAATISAHHAATSQRQRPAPGLMRNGNATDAHATADSAEQAALHPPEAASPESPTTGAAPAVGLDPASLLERYRDGDFFVSGERGAQQAQEEGFAVLDQTQRALASEVLDLHAEDSEGLAGQVRRRAWDSKKRKYVQLQSDEAVRAGKRVRVGGKMLKEGKRGETYKKWVKQMGGSAEAAVGKGAKGGGASVLGDRFKFGGRGWSNPLALQRANQAVKDEVKSEGELRKAAKKRERTKEHLKNKVSKKKGNGKPSAKHGKKGKQGKRTKGR